MPSPFIKQNIYGCSECAEENSTAPQLDFVGGFKSNEKKLELKVYKCPLCDLIYISINNEFLEGTFQDILE